MLISQKLLHPSGYHAGKHHAQCHKCCTDGVMCRTVTSPGKINEIQHVCREPKSIAKLFDKNADIDPRESEYENCFTISDKARCIAGGVLEALLHAGVLPE